MSSSHRSWPFSWIAQSHRALVFGRRTQVLAGALGPCIPDGVSVLDVGCGDGTVSALLKQSRTGLTIEGVEIIPRPTCQIPCHGFDGRHLPFPDQAFDVCLLVDVLHHTTDVTQLLCETARVARSFVVIKDHASQNPLDRATLHFMDWIGNRPYGVALPYNYQSSQQWKGHFAACGLHPAKFTTDVPLYPFPFSRLFGRTLHFVAQLRKV